MTQKLDDDEKRKRRLLRRLKQEAKNSDTEEAHINADHLLLVYINDDEITWAYNQIDKWFA